MLEDASSCSFGCALLRPLPPLGLTRLTQFTQLNSLNSVQLDTTRSQLAALVERVVGGERVTAGEALVALGLMGQQELDELDDMVGDDDEVSYDILVLYSVSLWLGYHVLLMARS